MERNPWPPSLGPDPDGDPDHSEGPSARPVTRAAPILAPGKPITGPIGPARHGVTEDTVAAETVKPPEQALVVRPSTAAPTPAPSPSWPAAEMVLAKQAGVHRRRRLRWPLSIGFVLVLVLVAVAAGYLSQGYTGWPGSETKESSARPSEQAKKPAGTLILEPGAPAQIYGPVITAADNVYSYPVPSTGDFDTNVLFKGEAPAYETSVASIHGSLVVKKYPLGVESADFDLKQAVVAEVQFLGGILDVKTKTIDGQQTVIVYLENVYGEAGHAIIAFVLLDRDEGTVLRIEGSDYAQGEDAQYSAESWQLVLEAAETLLENLRIGVAA